ncbi:meckelin [Chloropicon primus]|uniref:Meckelin n=1 Tax=Chloropicon primus TaxID=1764295 RepID=A0A5B8MJJ4_9CHLO|nr:meckelin [Chloropicon primus]UPQ98734.1 meckelin [Chloropicon primus]|eukprot:QDZ19522.1 meckelin [Chloropicon primus]
MEGLRLWVLAVVVLTGVLAAADTSFDYVKPCAGNEFFDILGLECLACPENSAVSSDGYSCSCSPGYIFRHSAQVSTNYLNDPFTTSTCVSCAVTGQGSSSTGKYCINCPSSEGVQAVGGQCECLVPGLDAVVEFDEHGEPLRDAVTGEYYAKCVSCPANTRLVEGKCVGCDYPKVLNVGTGVCACPAGGAGDHCLETDESSMISFLSSQLSLSIPVSSISRVSFYETGSSSGIPQARNVESHVFRTTLIPAAFYCLSEGYRESCNQLANLCVLTMYDDSHLACKLYDAILDKRQDTQYHEEDIKPSVGWKVGLPWLYYQRTPAQYAALTDLQLQVGFKSTGSAASQLTYVASVTGLNGTWYGIQNVTDQFIICGTRLTSAGEWTKFGTNFVANCNVDLPSLLKKFKLSKQVTDDVLFYDVYLVDQNYEYYPIGVKLMNLARNGQLVNKNANANGLQEVLVRRFVVVDSVSTLRSASSETQYLNYASEVGFSIEVQSGSKKNRLYPPMITVEIASVNMEMQSSSKLKASFLTRYTMNLGEFWDAFTILLIVALIASFFVWAQSIVAVLRKRQDLPIDMSFFASSITTLSRNVAVLFFLVLFAVSIYWLLFFKFQSEVYAILATDSKMATFNGVVVITTILTTVAVLELLWNQTHYDVFFIDWEKPWRILSPGEEKETEAPVSAWRTLFVGNEWNRLQTKRIASFELTIIVTVLIMVGFRVERLAQITPDQSDLDAHSYNEVSTILRFSLVSLCFIGLTTVQVAYKILFHHRYIEHPLEQFVDLCFLAKISCIFLDGPYNGYYIHGRNKMAHADTSLSELNKQFLKEEEGSVSSRGLVSQSSRKDVNENQSFEIFIPKKMRNTYDQKLLRKLQAAALEQREMTRMGVLGNLSSRPIGQTEKTVKAQKDLATEFTKMIADVESNISKQVREQITMQKLMGIAPDIDVVTQESKAMLFHDFSNTFGRLTFYKQEYLLIIWNLLVFASIDASVKNTAVSAALSWILYGVLMFWRKSYGSNNISQKSLIDSRFLV